MITKHKITDTVLQGLNSTDAIKAAKTRRPIIEPIGDFRELLSQCDLLRRNSQSRFLL